METVELSEFKKLFGNDLVGCTPRKCDHRLFLKIEESNVNVVTFSMDYPSTEILKDILNRAAEALKNINAIIIKNVSDNGISFTAYCKSDPKLKRITCNLNIIKPNQESNPLYDVVAVLRTGKDEIEHPDGTLLCNPMVLSPYSKQYVISKIDETKPIITDFELVNIFKSKFDFNIYFDSRDVGYVLSYLRANRHIYEQPTISREESYKSYIDFYDRNYLHNPLNTKLFGIRIKIFCSIMNKNINNKQVKKYYLTKLGKSYVNSPLKYYESLKEEENKGPNVISENEAFDNYFKENRYYYEDCRFTKFEAYKDYKEFCKNKSYTPLHKTDFYRLMLDECVVRRSKAMHGSECFVIDDNSSSKTLDRIRSQVPRIDTDIKDFMRYYQDRFKTYTYTRPEAFDLYNSYCESSTCEYIKKHDFYVAMQKYCIECRHRPSPKEEAKIYFIIRDGVVPEYRSGF